MSPVAIAAYLALFTTVGFGFLFANLLVGRFLRPDAPNKEKLEIYECGEPTIGSSFVQFDLRFYVVALLFIIFDVEIAFFFPWATVFGKANQLRTLEEAARVTASAKLDANATPAQRQTAEGIAYKRLAEAKFQELGLPNPTLAAGAGPLPSGTEFTVEQGGKSVVTTQPGKIAARINNLGRDIARYSIVDIGVFFAVLMVGFFYVWSRGDLDWVRALSRERGKQVRRVPPGAPREPEPELVGQS